MTKPSESAKTYTIGYFNANKWPIHLFISELNTTLQLQPNEYVLNKQGRKINDPFLERYCGPMRLSREESKTEKVDLISIPQTAVERRKYDGHAVKEATKFTKEPGGVRKPVIPEPIENPRPPEDTNPVKYYTIEDARKMGLINPTREIPEDFGVTDTDGAAPPGEKIPSIKYATDSKKGVHQQGKVDLSEAKTVDPSEAKAIAEAAGVPITNMELPKHPDAEDDDDDEEEGFANTQVTLPKPAIAGADQIPDPPLEEAPVEEETEEMPEPTNVLDVGDDDEEDEKPPVQRKARAPRREAAPVEEDEASETEEDEEPAGPRRRTSATKHKFECSACDDGPFRFRHQLERHARAEHRNQLDEIMEPYPED